MPCVFKVISSLVDDVDGKFSPGEKLNSGERERHTPRGHVPIINRQELADILNTSTIPKSVHENKLFNTTNNHWLQGTGDL